MKKILITTALALSAVSFTFAQNISTTTTATTTASTTMPDALPPVVLTGDAKADNQIRALRKEMEAKIKAIRDEYQKKVKALITAGVAAKKAANASSTKNMKASSTEPRGNGKDKNATTSAVLGTSTQGMLNSNRATTTKAAPKGNAWGFFMRFFGQAKPTASSTH